MRERVSDAELIAVATGLAGEFRPSTDCTAGGVAAALISRSGRVYTGICVDTACSMGFCAEHAAVAEMLKAREAEVGVIVAVSASGKVLSPCGRCRELLWQIHPSNRDTRVIISPNRSVVLAELLPQPSPHDA